MEPPNSPPRSNSASSSSNVFSLPDAISQAISNIQQRVPASSLGQPIFTGGQAAVQELVVSLSQQLNQQLPGSPRNVAASPRAAALPGQQAPSIVQQFSGTGPMQQLGETQAAAPSSDPTPSAVADETPAAAAERHRLASSHQLDLQALAKWVEGMLPYLFILAAVFVYHYCTGIFLCLWLLCSLAKANQLMRKLVAQKTDCQTSMIMAALLYIATNVAVVAWLTSGQRLYRSFLLQAPSPPITVWQAVFMVLVADSVVRFCCLAPKLLVVAAMQSWGGSSHGSRNVRRQARLLTLLEYLSGVYRAVVPIPVWYTYLLTCTLNNVFCALLAGFYLTFKGYGLLQQGQLVLVAAKLVLRTGALYGRYLGKAEANNACCPICQEPATAAVQLECNHVFCEECISEWLERGHRSCPMCRINIQPPGLQYFGDGATSLLPQVF